MAEVSRRTVASTRARSTSSARRSLAGTSRAAPTPIASPCTSARRSRRSRSLEGEFDFVFIDADKTGYIDYYEAVLPRLSERGLIAADNTLSGGRAVDGSRPEIVAFNEHVASDERVVCVLLPVRDGVTLIRRRP